MLSRNKKWQFWV